MIESTARAERYDLQTSKSSSYLWEVPQKPVAVRIPFSVMDRLEREAVEAFRSLSSRGSEIGGLLVGDVTSGNPLVVSIADYELISCDYARGPLYRLAEADMERFQRAMEKMKGGPGQTVAGFFRSHTRKGISLDADDLAFYQACFREPHHIGMLIRPFATKASTAGIFIWENGKIHGDASYLEFPFRSSELAGKPGGAPAPPPEPKAAAPAPPAASSSAAKPPARAQIVPIASRRDMSTPSEPAPAPTASAPVAPPPPVAAPEPPKIEEKPAPQDKGRFDRNLRKPAEQAKPAAPAPAPPAKAAAPAPPVKAAAPAPAAKPVEKAPEKSVAPAAPAKPAPKPAEKPVEKIVEKAVEKPVEAKSSGKALKLVLAAAVTMALLVVLFLYPGILRTSTKAPVTAGGDSSPLQLRVERSNGELLLTWNRDSDAIRSATKATLQITDGEQHENVDMDLSQLRNNGSIVYSPTSSDVSFTMEVVGRDQTKTKSEVVRVLRTKQSPLETQAEAKPAPVVTAVPTAQTKGPDPKQNTPSASTPTPAEEQPVATPEAPKQAAPRRAFDTSSVAPISQRLRPSMPTDIPDAPTAGVNTAAIPGVNLPNSGVVPGAPIAPPVARPNAPAPTAAAPAAAPTTVVNNGNAKQGGNIQQAVLISRKEPEYPKIAKQTGAKGAVVLNATIGKDGHIKAVKVVSGHPMLQNAAKEAVMQWVYKPTLLNGTSVETETQITLNFVGER